MQITEMTKEDFDKVPYFKETGLSTLTFNTVFNSIVIVPTGELHDSGYQMMDFVAVSNETYEPMYKLSGISDVIELDGIGGYGPNSINGCEILNGECAVPVKAWKIDCLPCGYLRLFARNGLYVMHHDFPVSSFEIYAK